MLSLTIKKKRKNWGQSGYHIQVKSPRLARAYRIFCGHYEISIEHFMPILSLLNDIIK